MLTLKLVKFVIVSPTDSSKGLLTSVTTNIFNISKIVKQKISSI